MQARARPRQVGSAPFSMNRTDFVAAMFSLAWSLVAAAQDAPPPAGANAQADPIDGLVATMRAAEQRLKTVALELRTTARLPSDLEVTTKGTVRVVRGEQASFHTRFDYTFGDGLRGRSECAQTAGGIVLYEDDAAFGEVFVRIDPAIVADLEWAGGVLHRDDLPGMPPREQQRAGSPRHATAPLGSAMVAALQRHFTLAVDGRTQRNGDEGTWLVGARKPGLDVQDPDLPIADRVEAFVRAKDHALLSVRQLVGDTVVQELTVDKVELDVELPPKLFDVDGNGQRLRPVQEHAPLWEQIDQAVLDAEARSDAGIVRPSKR